MLNSWIFCFLLLLFKMSSQHVFAQGYNQSAITEDDRTDITPSGSGDGDTALLPPECTSEYQREKDHTMCLFDDSRVVEAGLGEFDKHIIVFYHNLVRAQVTPSAEDLTLLTWDDNLAAVAQKWANQCRLQHDKNRNIPSYGMAVGQNLAAGHKNWKAAMTDWYLESRIFKYGQDLDTYLGQDEMIGHYTQMVYNGTHRIGCGFAKCRSTIYGRYYVCNYARGQSQFAVPYTKGETCDRCPNSCNDGYCDCNGKLCKHGGKLNLRTCRCDCPKLYAGDECEKLSCPDHDHHHCWRWYKPSHCTYNPTVQETCPGMCGLCGETMDRCPGFDHPYCWRQYQPQNCVDNSTVQDFCPWMCGLCGEAVATPPVFWSAQGCKHIGHRPTKEQCMRYGYAGSDARFCGHPGWMDCNKCHHFDSSLDILYNCPILCGICDPIICDGKECLNNGHIDVNTCTCSCPFPFYGDICESAYQL